MVNGKVQQPEKGIVFRNSEPFEMTIWIILPGDPYRQTEMLRVRKLEFIERKVIMSISCGPGPYAEVRPTKSMRLNKSGDISKSIYELYQGQTTNRLLI